MKGPRNRFLSVFTLLSRLPCRASFEPDYSRAEFWIPALSPLVSLSAAAGGTLGWLCLGEPAPAAICALAAQYLAFNLFHVDGLLDTADAMATFATPDRRLEILKDSRIGSYAFFFGLLVLGGKAVVLSSLFAKGFPVAAVALFAAPLAGRLACVLVPLLSSPARPGGLGSLMRGFRAERLAAGALVGGLPLAGVVLLMRPALELPVASMGLLAAAAGGSLLAGGLGAGAAMARLYRRRIGGFTGDALGAAVETGELACLVLLATALRLAPVLSLAAR